MVAKCLLPARSERDVSVAALSLGGRIVTFRDRFADANDLSFEVHIFPAKSEHSPMRIPVRTAIKTRVRPGSSKALKRRETSSVVKNRNRPRSGLGGSLAPVAGSLRNRNLSASLTT